MLFPKTIERKKRVRKEWQRPKILPFIGLVSKFFGRTETENFKQLKKTKLKSFAVFCDIIFIDIYFSNLKYMKCTLYFYFKIFSATEQNFIWLQTWKGAFIRCQILTCFGVNKPFWAAKDTLEIDQYLFLKFNILNIFYFYLMLIYTSNNEFLHHLWFNWSLKNSRNWELF